MDIEAARSDLVCALGCFINDDPEESYMEWPQGAEQYIYSALKHLTHDDDEQWAASMEVLNTRREFAKVLARRRIGLLPTPKSGEETLSWEE